MERLTEILFIELLRHRIVFSAPATEGWLAALADRVSVVRSFTTGNGNHDIKPIVCPETYHANIGSLYARVAGTNHPVTGMPTNAAVFPNAVDPQGPGPSNSFGVFASTGSLGAAFACPAPSHTLIVG